MNEWNYNYLWGVAQGQAQHKVKPSAVFASHSVLVQ